MTRPFRIPTAYLSCPALVLLTALSAFAEPPKVTLPAKVEGQSFAVLSAETDGKAVEYVPLDKGLEFFPAQLLRDSKVAVVFGPKGSYRVLAYSGNADGPSKPAYTTVVLGGAAPPAPGPGPNPPPTDPPVTPPAPAPGAKLYFLVVRPDGPASPAYTRTMQLPAWLVLRASGHMVKDFTVSEAAKFNLPAPGVAAPYVVTLRLSADGSASTVARDAVPLPSTSEGILELPKGVR